MPADEGRLRAVPRLELQLIARSLPVMPGSAFVVAAKRLSTSRKATGEWPLSDRQERKL